MPSLKNFAFRFSIVSLLVAGTGVAAGLPDGFVRFNGVEPSASDADLAKILGPLVGNRPIVAIGESVHGTSGYTKLQHRILKYLVQRKGFRIFVLEDPTLRSEGMTAALRKCGAPLPMPALYFPAEEDRALFKWVQNFNCAHPRDPIHFRGIDIWDRYWDLHARVIDGGRRLGLPGMDAVDQELKRYCQGHSAKNWDEAHVVEAEIKKLGHIPEDAYAPCMKALKTLIDRSERNYANAVDPRAKSTWAEYLHVLDTTYARQENLNFYYSDLTKDWAARDKGQARNVYDVWRRFGQRREKIVWISHTSHTSHMRSTSDWWKLGDGKFRSAVYFFEKFYRIPVVTLMLTSYHATGGQGDWVIPTSKDSLDLFLHERGEKYVAWDPRSPFVRSRPRWWVSNENTDAPDAYRDGVFMIPKDNFDLFFYVDETLKGKPILPWVSPWEW